MTDDCLAAELALNRAVDYFGAARELDTVRVSHVRGWIAWLDALTLPHHRRGPGTVRHSLNHLSNLYRRAQEEEVVLPGYNPVAAIMDKPVAPRREARWLEPHDAALVLEPARHLPPIGSVGPRWMSLRWTTYGPSGRRARSSRPGLQGRPTGSLTWWWAASSPASSPRDHRG